MTAPLRKVLLRAPGASFGRAYDDPTHGFLHPVDLILAQRQHSAFADLLTRLGVEVEVLGDNDLGPDSVYVFDPLLITDRGAVSLRMGKPTRRGEEAALERWATGSGIPTLGSVEVPGTVEGGDTFWLRPDLLCVGRSLRTNTEGAAQLARLVGGRVEVFDLPWWHGPSEVLHLLSLISPITDDLALVYRPLLPSGLAVLLDALEVRTVAVSDDEFATLGCNVLAVKPGVVIVAEGNPQTCAALAAAGCEVHTLDLSEIGLNGSGGPTCLTRPVLRDTTGSQSQGTSTSVRQ